MGTLTVVMMFVFVEVDASAIKIAISCEQRKRVVGHKIHVQSSMKNKNILLFINFFLICNSCQYQ